MSNTIDYNIQKCSQGESYDMSQSASNSVTGNIVVSSIAQCGPGNTDLIPSISLVFTSNSSYPSLVGFPEWMDISTPPRFYRKKIVGPGFTERCNKVRCEDITYQGSDSAYYTGVESYDKYTGEFSTTAHLVTKQNFGSCPASTVIYDGETTFPTIRYGLQDHYGFAISIDSRITTEERYKDGCNNWGYAPYFFAETSSSSRRVFTLSDEDTDSDAINRAAWTVGNDSVSIRTIRTARGFSYVKVSVNASCSQLMTGKWYTISYSVKTTNLSTSDYVIENKTYQFKASAQNQLVAIPTLDANSGFSCEITAYSIVKN